MLKDVLPVPFGLMEAAMDEARETLEAEYRVGMVLFEGSRVRAIGPGLGEEGATASV